MKREEFVRAYAWRSGLAAPYAILGFIEVQPFARIAALPCACGEPDCPGWAMVSMEFVDHHLTFQAPKELSDAYLKAIAERESNNG